MKKLLAKIRKILRDRRTRRFLTRFVSGVAALIVFVTTYALVLPAITMEKEANCGIEAHQHDDSCYTEELICDIPESDGHHHDESCYSTTSALVCETEEHEHSAENGCYDDEGNLICEVMEHRHNEECYEEVRELTCQIPESEGHHHTEDCYEKVLTCGKEVHVHSTACYENDPVSESAIAASTSSAAASTTSAGSVSSAGMTLNFEGDIEKIIDTDEPVDDDSVDNIGSDETNGSSETNGTSEIASSDKTNTEAASDTEVTYGRENAGTGHTETSNTALTNSDNSTTALTSSADADQYIPQLDAVDFNTVLNNHTGIYYYRAADEDIVEDSSAIPAEDWNRIPNNIDRINDDMDDVELGSKDLLRVYLSYTIPAGSLNATNPVARYRLPSNIHLTDPQVKAINENVNGLAGQYVDMSTLEITDPDKYNAYLGVEAVEGTRRPDEAVEDYLAEQARKAGKDTDDATEYISAVVRVENVYDADGLYGEKDAYLGQDLIFTFAPYSIEKNQHEYDSTGKPTRAGEEIKGWFTFDLNMGQVDFEEPEITTSTAEETSDIEDNVDGDSESRHSEDENTEENHAENVQTEDDHNGDDLIKEDSIEDGHKDESNEENHSANNTTVDVNTADNESSEDGKAADNQDRVVTIERAERTAEIIFVEEEWDGKDKKIDQISTTLTAVEETVLEAQNDDNMEDDEDPSVSGEKERLVEENEAATSDETTADGNVKDPVDTEQVIMPAMGFNDSIKVSTGKPVGIDENAGSFLANAAESLPEEAEVSVRVEADEGTFPAGTTMVLSAVDQSSYDTLAETLAETVERRETSDTDISDTDTSEAKANTQQAETDNAEDQEIKQNTEQNNADNNTNIKTYGFQAVDITFFDKDGNEIEPAKPVRVALTSKVVEQAREKAEESAIADPVVVHVDNEGKAEQMDLVSPEEVEPAKGRSEEELIEEAEKTAESGKTDNADNDISADDSMVKKDIEHEADENYSVNNESADGSTEDAAGTSVDNKDSTSDETSNVDVDKNQADAVGEAAPTVSKDADAAEESATAEGTAQADTAVEEDGESSDTAEFTADSFSVYAIVYTVELYTNVITDSGETYRITVTYDETSGIPQDAELKVKEIKEGDKGYKDYYTEAVKAASESSDAQNDASNNASDKDNKRVNPDKTYARFFDIEIWANGEKVEPAGDVSVSIRLLDVPETDDKSVIKIVHFAQDDIEVIPHTEAADHAESLDSTKDQDDKQAENSTSGEMEFNFTASSFSVYSVVSYTVDFHWVVDGEEYVFSMPGGGYVTLQQLVEVLGIANSGNASDTKGNSGKFSEEGNDYNVGEVSGVDDGIASSEGRNSQSQSIENNETGGGSSEYNDSQSESAHYSNTQPQTVLTLADLVISDKTRDFVTDVMNVEFSNPELVWVGKVDADTTVRGIKEAQELGVQYSDDLTEEQIETINTSKVESGDWALISLHAFLSQETLTVTMKNGDRYVIRVTDAQRIGNQLNGKSYVIKNQKSQAYAMTAPGFSFNSQNYMTAATVSDTNNQIWTFEYSNNNGGSYRLKSALNGKYLTVDGFNGKGLTLSDNGSYFYVEEGNGEYSIYYTNNSQKYYINFYNDGGTGKNYTINTENEISYNSSHHDNTFILKELEPSLNVPSNNWLLYLDEDKTEITINKGDTLTLRPYGEWYWKNEDQPTDLQGGEWTFDSTSWNTTRVYNEYVNAAGKSITYFSKATAKNGTIEFTGYPKWDSEVKELYPVLNGKANGVGDFVLKTTKGKTITVHVVESGAEHPAVVQKTEKIKVNLFDYDRNGDLDPSDKNSNIVGNIKYDNINNNSYSNDLKFLSSGGGQAQNNPAPINAYTNQDANQGIVDNTLKLNNSDQKYYPRLANQFGNDDLRYLFNTNQKNWTNDGAMIAYPDVEGLFQKDTQGYYFFNSNSNYAYYNGSKIVLYDHTYTQQTGDTGKENAKPIGFFPFHQYDPTHDLTVNNNKNLNHHLGMSMQVDFKLPSDKKNKGNPIIFEFTGDDDLWVFVDNTLVLDIGGIHQPVRGYIDFTNGKVYVYDKDGGTLLKEDSFVKNLAVNVSHKLDMFYLERGGCDSNLAVRFNLPIVEDFTLEKKLAGLTETERQKYKDVEFLYDVYVNGSLYSGTGAIRKNAAGQQVGSAFSVTNGRVALKDGETVTITGLTTTDRVYVVERSLNMEQFEDPTAKRYYPSETDNEQLEEVISLTKSQSQNAAANVNDWSTQTYDLDKAEKITYTNTLKEKDLEVEKQWVGDKEHPDEISFTVGAAVEGNDQTMVPYAVSLLKDENGTDDKVFTLGSDNDWKTFIYHLPVTSPDGKPIVYSIREAEVEGYISSTVDITGESYNYCTVDAVKIWPDETTHNEVINIRLKNSDGKYFSGSYNNGEAVFVDNVSGAGIFQLNKSNNFTHHFDLLSAGKTYTVELAEGEEELAKGLVTYMRSVIQYKLINTPIGSQVDPEGPQDNPEIHKRIDALRDGASNPDSLHQGEDLTDLYRLYLDYKVNSLQEAEGVDLLFVIDHSGSMNSDCYQGNHHRARSVMEALNGNNGVIADFLKMGETEGGDNKNRWAAVGFKGPYGINYVRLWGDSGYRSPNAGENDSEILSGNDYSWYTNRTDINLPLEDTSLMYDPRYGWIPYGSTVLTDYTAGFWRAEQFLLQDTIKNDKKKKVIVFISDGIPTLHIPGLDTAQSLVGADEVNGSRYYPDDDGGCPEQAKTQFGYFVNDMKNIGGYEFGKDIEIYTVGFGGSMSSGTQGETLLKGMLNIAYGNNSHDSTNYMAINDINPNGDYTATASNKLKEDLRTVLGMNEKFTNIIIQDNLSRYVDLYGLASLAQNASVSDIMNAAKVKVTMTIPDTNNSGQSRTVVLYENGAPGTASEARFTKTTGNSTSTVPIISGFEYNSDTKTIKAVFDPDYEAVEGVTYTLSFDVRATDEAYSTYADSGYDKYPAEDEHAGQVIKGDDDTDFLGTDPDNATSVNKPGFRSNDEAKATYHHNEKPEEREYLHPVVQVAATIDIVKVDELGSALEGAKFNLYGKDYDSSKTLDENRPSLIQENLQSKKPTNPAGNDAVIRSGRLSAGTYYLVETEAPDGYNSLSAPVKITVTQEDTEGILSVTAEIEGIPAGDKLQRVEGKKGFWQLKIPNTAGYELPASGGSGTNQIYLLGIMFVGFAGAILVMRRRRKEA